MISKLECIKKAIICDIDYTCEKTPTSEGAYSKKEIYKKHIQEKYDVLFVLDDRAQVVKM